MTRHPVTFDIDLDVFSLHDLYGLTQLLVERVLGGDLNDA